MGRLLLPLQECKRAQAVKQNEDVGREQQVFQQLCSALLLLRVIASMCPCRVSSSLGNPKLGQDLLQGSRELCDDHSVFIPEN